MRRNRWMWTLRNGLLHARRWPGAWGPAVSSDRGDVPGWVLVAVMTAGLVTALWILADHQLTAVFSRAIDAVSSP